MISEAKLALELGKTVEEIQAVRRSKLSTDQWCNKGKGVSLSDEGEALVRTHFEFPEVVPPKKKAFVRSEARNPRYVWCNLEGMEGRFPVAIPRRFYGKLVGKYITVEEITDISGTSYRHEWLGR